MVAYLKKTLFKDFDFRDSGHATFADGQRPSVVGV
jgi:hypothetical protein